MRWKAGPEKPRTKFCWSCSLPFHGRVHARVRGIDDGALHDVHKTCLQAALTVCELVYESSTASGAATPMKGGRE